MSAHNGSNPLKRAWESLRAQWSASPPDAESYRRLALQLDRRLAAAGRRSILVVTAEGSTLCAQGTALLARGAADSLRQPVLLVDAFPPDGHADGARTSPAGPGLSDVLAAPGRPLDEVVRPTTRDNLFLLPAGNGRGHPPRNEAALRSLVEDAERRFGLVLFSGGSVLGDVLPQQLAPCVGLVILLAIENETRVEDLDAARDALVLSGARQVGLVLATPERSRGSDRPTMSISSDP
jgi:Mrp family chromosome partitioning ATPase